MTVGLMVVIALAAVGLGGALGGFFAPPRYRSTSAATGLGAGCLTPIAGIAGTVASLVAAFKSVAHVSPERKAEILSVAINASMASTVWGIVAGAVIVAVGASAFALMPKARAGTPAEVPPSTTDAPRLP